MLGLTTRSRRTSCNLCGCFWRHFLLLPRKALAPFGNPTLNVFRAVPDADAEPLHPAALDGHRDGLECRRVVAALVVVVGTVHHIAMGLDDAGRGGKMGALRAGDVTAHVGLQSGGGIQLQVVTGAADEQLWWFARCGRSSCGWRRRLRSTAWCVVVVAQEDGVQQQEGEDSEARCVGCCTDSTAAALLAASWPFWWWRWRRRRVVRRRIKSRRIRHFLQGLSLINQGRQKKYDSAMMV